ncbi:hypothetical protein ACFL6I_23505 [candidate division KSB1 bacterium]
MKIYNKKGMMEFPNPFRREKICDQKNILVVKNCFCQNGHSLIDRRAVFNEFNGIVIKVKNDKEQGYVALSPVYGYKSRVSLDIDLRKGEIYHIHCPECDVGLPVYSSCSCGGSIINLFLDKTANYDNSIGFCNRVGCLNAGIYHSDELINLSRVENMRYIFRK